MRSLPPPSPFEVWQFGEKWFWFLLKPNGDDIKYGPFDTQVEAYRDIFATFVSNPQIECVSRFYGN